VGELTKEIDSLHAQGAGEEYLARLVRASETGQANARALKEALVTDIAEVMRGIAVQQADIYTRENRAASEHIAEAVKTALQEPMAKISKAVEDATRGQRDAASIMLERLLTGFMAKMGDAFGQQIEGINASFQSSSDAIGRVQNAMERSIDSISSASVVATERMSDRLEDSLARALTVQEQMGQKLLEQQQKSSETTDIIMRSVLSRLQDALSAIAAERQAQVEQDERRHDMLTSSITRLHASLTESVGGLVEHMRLAAEQSAENITALQDTTLNAIFGLRDGAAIMREAAGKLSDAGNSVSGIPSALAQTAEGLKNTAESVHAALQDHAKMQETIRLYMAEMQEMVRTTQRETGVSSQLVSEMERIVKAMARAERESEDYLRAINDVLKQSFRDFGAEMVAQVRNISTESNRQLGSSLHALTGTVDSMIASVTKLRRTG